MASHLSPQHAWLGHLTGRWTVVFDMADHPVWQEEVRSLDGLWSICEQTGAMGGGEPATVVTMLGYDPAKERYVGSVAGSMMPCLWVYEGALDETGKVLTLDCEGPDFDVSDRIARYRDTITLVDENTRLFRSQVLAADGSWKPVMASTYTRMS